MAFWDSWFGRPSAKGVREFAAINRQSIKNLEAQEKLFRRDLKLCGEVEYLLNALPLVKHNNPYLAVNPNDRSNFAVFLSEASRTVLDVKKLVLDNRQIERSDTKSAAHLQTSHAAIIALQNELARDLTKLSEDLRWLIDNTRYFIVLQNRAPRDWQNWPIITNDNAARTGFTRLASVREQIGAVANKLNKLYNLELNEKKIIARAALLQPA